MIALHGGSSIPVVAPTDADGVFVLLWLVIALPLAGAAVLLIGGRYTDKWGHLLGTLLPIGSFVLSLAMFISLLGREDDDRQVSQHLYTWFQTGHLDVGMDLLYDPLSALFLLLITGVGSLIHVYSIGYMAHDPRRRRFFGYLNLFVAAMLMLVLSENYLGLFLGWEGVGLASYLLIGFWQHKPSAAAAGKKAFVINRVGDMGLSLAIMMFFVLFGSTSFSVISENIGNASEKQATILGFLLLLGACGKSAQFPLQAWLLDAMEGPTPVSALIHAATMVTAGVYLIVRSNFVFDLAPNAQTAVVVVAIISIFWGAWIGCAKDDIKKALAGSTMSQIGYMMLAAGLGVAGYAFAIFHLLTHGFFGFWSKDKIIEVALADNWIVGLCALLGAGITGFYMTRLMLMTFYTEKRWEKGVHPHESPKVMTIPLIVLAALSVLGGVMLIGDWIVDFLSPVTGVAPHEEPPLPAIAVTVIAVCVVAVGVAVAWFLVGKRPVPREAPQDVSWVTQAGRNEVYGNQINDTLVVNPSKHLTAALLATDKHVVDGVLTGGPVAVGGFAGFARRIQNGYVRSYALSILGGALIVA